MLNNILSFDDTVKLIVSEKDGDISYLVIWYNFYLEKFLTNDKDKVIKFITDMFTPDCYITIYDIDKISKGDYITKKLSTTVRHLTDDVDL